jgi:hypothetical protein
MNEVTLRYQKWQIRILVLAQIVCVLAFAWDDLRISFIFPEGTTPADALIYFFLLFLLEEVTRIKAHLGVE